MNRHVVGALFEDAFRQVLDDKVFRLLVVLALILVLPTFVLGFGPDGMSLLFGWKHWTYAELLSGFGGGGLSVNQPDLRQRVIAGIQTAIAEQFVGTIGLFFCVAATAFFVPRMLEKGAADTLFSKPVGRFALLVARYSAGVIFVACLSVLLVFGMHVGFLVSSGHSDPAFLWTALTLTYVFALVHCVSVTVAVFTRSSIAALLTTLMFFSFTGCVQRGWISAEHMDAMRVEAEARGDDDAPKGEGLGFLRALLETLHWTLPKTSDADYVVANLRRSISEPEPALRDSNGYVSVLASPTGFAREGPATADLGASPALWIARDPSGEEIARIALSRRDRSDPERPGKLRSASSFASDHAKAVEKDGTTAQRPDRSRRQEYGEIEATWVRWRVRGAAADVERARGFTSVEDALYEVDAAFEPVFGDGAERERALRAFLTEMQVDRKSATSMTTEQWYTRAFGWTAPMRHNAFVSIGTSLLFALALLYAARWRLARIDF